MSSNNNSKNWLQTNHGIPPNFEGTAEEWWQLPTEAQNDILNAHFVSCPSDRQMAIAMEEEQKAYNKSYLENYRQQHSIAEQQLQLASKNGDVALEAIHATTPTKKRTRIDHEAGSPLRPLMHAGPYGSPFTSPSSARPPIPYWSYGSIPFASSSAGPTTGPPIPFASSSSSSARPFASSLSSSARPTTGAGPTTTGHNNSAVVALLQKKLQKAEKRSKKLEELRDKLMTHNTFLKDAKENLEQANVKISAENKELKDDNNKLTIHNICLSSDKQKIMEDNDKLTIDNERLESDNLKLSTENKDLKDDKIGFAAVSSSLVAQVEDLLDVLEEDATIEEDWRVCWTHRKQAAFRKSATKKWKVNDSTGQFWIVNKIVHGNYELCVAKRKKIVQVEYDLP